MKKSFSMFWKDVCWSIDDVFEKYFAIMATIGVLIFVFIFSLASFFGPLFAVLNNMSPWYLTSYLVLLPVNIFLWMFVVCLRERI